MVARAIYQIEIRHQELNKYRLIRGTDPYVVQQKAETQQAAWAEIWARKEAALQRASAKEEIKQLAERRTREAQKALQGIEILLKASLDTRSEVDWEKLKDKRPYPVPAPEKPQPVAPPREPSAEDRNYSPKLGILDRLER